MGCRITYRLMTNPAEIPTPSTMEMSLINSEPELLLPRAKTKSALTPPSVDPPPTGVELYMKLIRRESIQFQRSELGSLAEYKEVQQTRFVGV